MAKLKVAQLQTYVHREKLKNIETVASLLEIVTGEQVDMVTLPEMFACPYDNASFPLYAEQEGGELWQKCASLAKEYGVYLSAGSMPEVDDNRRVFNTAYVFDREGRQIAKHRKAHLFDINVQGGQYFKESDTLSPGNQITVFETEVCKMGICICYDFRFPELARLMALKGAKVILVPGAFNMTTGPAHWELMFRSRALDNQVFALGTAPARDVSSGYVSWGHSIAVGPWGNLLGQMEERDGFMIQELDLDVVDQIRAQLPLLLHRRRDMYVLGEV